MSDLVWGIIIGGVIGVVGSAVTALIQGNYSLKAKREENLAREQQQSIQIQHEKSRELTNRLIKVREGYLESLCEQLGKLRASVDDFGDKFLHVMVGYVARPTEATGDTQWFEQIDINEKVEIKVEPAKQQQLRQKLDTLEGEISLVAAIRTGIYDSAFRVTDTRLHQLIRDVIGRVFSLHESYLKMQLDLARIKDGEDFVYDLAPILRLVPEVSSETGSAHSRIESLLAGADTDAE